MNNPFLVNHRSSHGSIRKALVFCVALSAASLANAVCVPTATTACLANQPVMSTSVVKPNLMFILDNSGSMDWDYMPDSATTTDARRKNYQYNTVYYNPNFNYTAARPLYPDTVTGAILTAASQSFTSAQCDPYVNTAGVVGCANYGATTVNLSTSFRAHGSDTARPAYYCRYDGGSGKGASPCARSGYVRVDVSATSCAVNGDVTSCPTGADERENFANWFSYFRTRILMMKSGMSSAFAPLDDSMRVGFYTINNPTAGVANNGAARNILDFSGGATGTPKGDWFAALFRMRPASGTPLQQALDRVGRYYSGLSATGLSGDPIQYSCQKNFAILSTDGGWNGANTGRGNWDRTVPASMPTRPGVAYNPADTGLTEGMQFPKPYYEGATASSDTLADIAMYYWTRDLRTTGTVAANNVFTNDSDPAYWQHMNLFTIGLGVAGTLSPPGNGSIADWCALHTPSTLPTDCIVNGVPYSGPWKNWPATPNGGDTDTTNLSKFDDLWHAAVNGRGKYYSATDPASLSTGLASALKAIVDTPSYGSPAASTSDFKALNQNDFTTYVTSYRTINWSGDVKKYNIDKTTGVKTGSALWSAAKQLDSKANPGLTSSVDLTAYTTRNIVTRTEAGVPVAFTFATISPTQQTALCYKATPGTGPCIAGDSSVVDYLRGQALWEGDYGVGSSRFRKRHDSTETTYYKRSLLGDIVNSDAAYVAAEQAIYQDTGYAAFKESTKAPTGRNPTLYVGANDGMLHAFDGATGNELWAYIPSFVIPSTTDEDGKEKGLRALSYQYSGAPAYKHHYYVDGPLEVGAVDFNVTGSASPIIAPSVTNPNPEDWHTILVGGLGKGGKGYFALDVTTPATNMAQAKSKVMWEFPSASDPSHAPVISGGWMGYSFGKPIIAKTKLYGWVAIVPSGFNNSDGYGYLFVLNAKTGALLEQLKTPTQAHGMAHVTFLGRARNKFVEQAYAGDIDGNLWRFEFNGVTFTGPRVQKIFTSSTSTPMATQPNVSIDVNTGVRWVFFGTGQYLDESDRTIPGGYQQYIVALRDGNSALPGLSAPVDFPSLTNLTLTDITNTGVPGVTTGWKLALPGTGERNALAPVADVNTVVFSTLTPINDPCNPDVNGRAYILDFSTGRSRYLDASGNRLAFFPSPSGIASVVLVQGGKGPGTSGPIRLVISSKDGTSVSHATDPSGIFSSTRRVTWRELLVDN